MATHTAIRIAAICMLALITSPSLAQECFQIRLPEGHKEIRVPANLALVRYQGQSTLTPAGFWLYHGGENLSLSGPGRFCLAQDIVRNVGIAKLLGEPGGSGPLIQLSNSDITLDLRGHTLRSDRAGVAIEGYVGGKIHQTSPHTFSFTNGSIEVNGKGVSFTGWQYVGYRHNYRPDPALLDTVTEWYGPDFGDFSDTNILLENLTIKSGGLAAYLIGRNNVIRHCRIEVEGHEAVALFGANNQLIDNEIIVRRTLPPPVAQDNSRPRFGTYYLDYAAIWIRDAPGLILRGNKITIEGLFNAEQAILLANSPDVVIEDNEVTGANNLYKALDGQSSARAHNNRKRFGKWPDN